VKEGRGRRISRGRGVVVSFHFYFSAFLLERGRRGDGENDG
jgi:hypothetical protein